jgi:hypothetical protein
MDKKLKNNNIKDGGALTFKLDNQKILIKNTIFEKNSARVIHYEK